MSFINHIKKSFGIHNFGHAYNDIYFMLVPILLPLLKAEFNLSYVQSGLLVTGHIGMRSLFSYISGHLGDRYDKRVIISAGFFLSSIILAALVWAGSIYTVTGFLLLLGMTISTFHPLATALVGEEAHSDHRAFYIGVFESTGAIGIIVSTMTFGFLVESWGWRNLCLLIAIPGFLMGWAYLKSNKEVKKDDIEAEHDVGRKNIILFVIARGIRALGTGALFSFLPTFATDQVGLTAAGSSYIMATLFLGTIPGSLGGGYLSDRKSPLMVITLTMAITIPIIIGMTYITHHLLFFVLVFIFGTVNGSFFGPQNCWLTTVSTTETRGKVMGFAFLIDGFSITIAPTIFGWIADQTGLVSSFLWTLLPVAFSLLFFIFLYRKINNEIPAI